MARSIDLSADFEFNRDCQYGALVAGSKQIRAIRDYERTNKLAVHYQFYNPWTVPFSQRIPLRQYARPPGQLSLGARVVPAKAVHAFLDKQMEGYRLTLDDLGCFGPNDDHFGWPIEHFVADFFLGCREGTPFKKPSDETIQTLFYRRSGPIAAAIAITIEGPEVEVG